MQDFCISIFGRLILLHKYAGRLLINKETEIIFLVCCSHTCYTMLEFTQNRIISPWDVLLLQITKFYYSHQSLKVGNKTCCVWSLDFKSWYSGILIIKSSNLSLSLLNWLGESCEKEQTLRTWSDASMTDSFFFHLWKNLEK